MTELSHMICDVWRRLMMTLVSVDVWTTTTIQFGKLIMSMTFAIDNATHDYNKLLLVHCIANNLIMSWVAIPTLEEMKNVNSLRI